MKKIPPITQITQIKIEFDKIEPKDIFPEYYVLMSADEIVSLSGLNIADIEKLK